MLKWWWKLDTQKGIWQDIVRARYLRNQTVATVGPRFSDSPCWKNLLKSNNLYMIGRKIHVGTGNLTRLWKDSINGLTLFQEQFPRLFDICIDQDCTLDKLESIACASFFRRRLDTDLIEQWSNLRGQVRNMNLSDTPVMWSIPRSSPWTYLHLPRHHLDL